MLVLPATDCRIANPVMRIIMIKYRMIMAAISKEILVLPATVL